VVDTSDVESNVLANRGLAATSPIDLLYPPGSFKDS